jgi:hypothetical protein
MKMKTYPERARAAALQEIEEGRSQKSFGAATEINSLEVMRRMKDEGVIEQSNALGGDPVYRTTHEEIAPTKAPTTEPLTEHKEEN